MANIFHKFCIGVAVISIFFMMYKVYELVALKFGNVLGMVAVIIYIALMLEAIAGIITGIVKSNKNS